ncbi:MAG: (d)CMP kinase [Polyangiales bacterium]
MSRRRPVIAIDGPAGAGKSTVARELARRLGYTLVDTGALYRGVALAAKERHVRWDDGPGLGALAASLRLAFDGQPDGSQRLQIDGRDRGDDIRTPEISMGASDVSKLPEVRAALLGIQRELGRDGGVVLEGRDIGTVVFPDAEAKVFLTASAEKRARRRVEELRARGVPADFATTLGEVEARDAQDQNRAVAPLKPAPDSVVVDTSELGIEQVVQRLLELVRRAGA